MKKCNILRCWMLSWNNGFPQSLSHTDTIMVYVYQKKNRWKGCRVLFCIMFHLPTVWLGNLSKVFLTCFFLLLPIMYDWMIALIKFCISFSFFLLLLLKSHLLFVSVTLRKFFPVCNKFREWECSLWHYFFLLTWLACIILYDLFFVLLIACRSFRNVDSLYVLCSNNYANNSPAWK